MSLSELVEFLCFSVKSSLLYNQSSLATTIRRQLYQTTCKIDTGVIVTNPDQFRCGENCALYHGTYVLNRNNGKMVMGDRSHLGAMCYVNIQYKTLEIGDDVAIGPHSDLIGYSNDYAPRKRVTECKKKDDIIIGNNVFIGAHTVVLPGTRIGNNVVIGAGSIVKGKLRSNCIYAGSPCKRVRKDWYNE